MNSRSGGLAGVLLLVAWNGSGHAAPPDAGQDLTPTARELSDQALRQYQQGQFDAAIESFMGAFALSNNAGLLFNVAQAYRLKGDCEHARDYYQRYLGAVPETPFRQSLERRVAEMKACFDNRGATASAAAGDTMRASPTTAVMATAVRPAPPKPDLVSPKREASPARQAAVWTLRGSGAALLATSAVFGALTWSAYRDIENAPTMRVAWDAKDRYQTDSALAWTFAATGAVCAVISYLVGRHR